jgi:CHAT domain-containing protein
MSDLTAGSVAAIKKSVLTRRRLLTVLMSVLGVVCLPPVMAQAPPGMTPRVNEILKAAATASEEGDSARQREILEQGLQTVGSSGVEAHFLYDRLSTSYADLGNLQRAADMAEKLYETARFPGHEWNGLVRLVSLYSGLHNKTKQKRYASLLDQVIPRLRSSQGWTRFGPVWQAGAAWAKGNAFRLSGHFPDAESAFKACIGSAQQSVRESPDLSGGFFYLADCTGGLMMVQIATGQLAAAGAVADQLLASIDEVAKRQKRPIAVTRMRGVLGQLAMEQGRLDDARKILLDTLAKFQEDKESAGSLRVAALYLQLAQLEMLQSHWSGAVEWHQKRRAALTAMDKERGMMGTASPDFAYTLIRLGKSTEALTMMRRILEIRSELHDQSSADYWESRVFFGIALAGSGRKDEALMELRVAIPRYLDLIKGERSSSDAGVLRTARLNWLLDGYIRLLSDHAANGDAAALDEAFRMADLARGSTVQRALAASASRANVSDPALAELARQEQDLQREISSLAESIGNLLARGRIAEQDKIVSDMRTDLVSLRERHAKVQTEIERRFPDYAALLNPKPVGIAAIQQLLKPTEAVISIYAGSDRSLVWAIPARGAASFAVVPLAGEQLDKLVMTLREALDPNADAAGKLPKYRFDISHELYLKLLAPVQAGWKDARELIVIPHGRLGQLPFGVLTTAPFSAQPAKLEFAEMADAPWLIKQLAVSQLPAAVAMPALRAQASGQRAERAFVGFGDPSFMPDQPKLTAVTRGAITRRNLPASVVTGAASSSDPQLAPPINFKLLPALPDTALEIDEVAGVLAAEKSRDVFVQLRASEALVKKTNLAPYRVVMFATHGLMSGEMPGLYQPALALTNPALSGDGEDGMLTMEEILGLKLKADWVVLSACNSAAAGGQSTESVSGLGRAFFYAGAKSLLVTNWAVETESARMLTTEAFRLQAKDPTLARARALQQSSLALMKKSAGSDYSYAHPMFWAPYTLVGDGG